MATNIWISTTSVDYNVAGNWSDGVPNAADDVRLENSNIDIGATLDQSGVALTSFTQYASYSGRIGLCNLSATPGTAGTYLQIDAATCVLGRVPIQGATFRGSPRIMLDLGTGQACLCTVESTCEVSADQGLPPVRLKGVDAAHALRVWSGWVGVAVARSDEVSTFATIEVGKPGSKAKILDVTTSAGVTIGTALNVNGGRCLCLGVLVAGNVYGGTLIQRGAGTVSGTVTVYPNARYVWEGTGTAAAVIVKKGGKFDYSNGRGTISTLTFDDKNDLIESSAVTVTTRTYTGKEGGGDSGNGVWV